ncbi:MAG: hypothetical protein H0U46_11855 [Actinobacteria bacterium]|nr:hypothetical protein [Actinomycetota bacterium]
MIGRREILQAVLDVTRDPREIDETIRDLGVDPEAVVSETSAMVLPMVEILERQGIEVTDIFRLALSNLALSGFVAGLAVGREAAFDEAPA